MSNRKRAEKVDYASSIRSFFQIVTNPFLLNTEVLCSIHYDIIRHSIDFTLISLSYNVSNSCEMGNFTSFAA